MPAEEFNYKGSDVLSRVRTQFGDVSGAQLGDDPVLQWINDGQREIVNSNPILRASKVTDIVAGQQDYTFPNDKVLGIEAIYIGGYPIKNLSPQAAREFIMSADPKAESTAERPDIFYERAGVITFYPVPNLTITNGLKLEYIKNPTPLTSFDEYLSIPDTYFNALVNYVTSMAMEMDENYDAATYKHRQFRDGLDRLSQKENISQTDLYVQVLPDVDDFI
jgi:hypothetical protein